MKIKVDLTNDEVRALIIRELSSKVGGTLHEDSVIIKVRSKQNYRDKEWEKGEFQVSYEGEV